VKPTRLVLNVHAPELTGSGGEITWKVRGWRTTKTGRHVSYDLELTGCRHSIRQMLAEIRKMHLRDRERLAQEQARIVRETAELTQEQP
jgi:hypothetical protein